MPTEHRQNRKTVIAGKVAAFMLLCRIHRPGRHTCEGLSGQCAKAPFREKPLSGHARTWNGRARAPILPLMKKAPSYEDLADRLLDLWQDQVTAMADDQDLADLMRRQFTVASQAGQAAWGMSAMAPCRRRRQAAQAQARRQAG